MAQTTDRTLAAQKRAEARRARKLARMENQWAQGSLLVFTAVIMPFTNFFVVSDLVRQITVPEYIMEVIGDTPLYFGLYLAVSVLLLSVAGVGLLFTGLLYAVGLSGEGVLDSLLTVKTEITSHRGYSAKAPENTLPSIQAAIDSGVSDYAEIDVQQTSDGVVVLTHDTSLKRCTGLDANVHDVTYEQLRTLDASKGYSGADAAQFAGTPIPTLEEVILLCMGVGNYYDLAAADIFSVESTFVTTGMVNALHLRGKQVHAWTIDEPANAERMIRLGVDNLITGDPEMVREVIQKSEQLGWFSYLSDEKWTELAEEMGVNMEEYASLMDAA